MRIGNIYGGNILVFWATWISMKFSGRMWLMIKLKSTKNQGFTIYPKYVFLEKPEGWEGGGGARVTLSLPHPVEI